MKANIDIRTDYPVITAEPAERAQQLPAGGGDGGRGRPGGSGRFAQEVEMDEALLARYGAARTEWVEVQRLLIEQYGQQMRESAGPRARHMRIMERESASPEWLPEEQGWWRRG